MSIDKARLAEIRVVEHRVVEHDLGRLIQITIPKGTLVKDAFQLHEAVTGVIFKLTGCPCNSGIPVLFHELDVIQPIQVELQHR